MRYIKLLLAFFVDIMRNRRLLWELTKKDLQTRYLGSYLGILWAFIQPTITVLIFWFVFQVGFKSMPVEKMTEKLNPEGVVIDVKAILESASFIKMGFDFWRL